jgi:hypothetical protein
MKEYIGVRVYMKPLLPPGRAGARIPVDKVLQRSKQHLLRRLKANLLQTTFSPQAKAALARAVSIRLKPSSLQVVAKHPAYRPLVEGQHPVQMRWLLKARRPIPIVLDDGRLIFRNATPRSMVQSSLGAKPGWWHPGRTPQNYVEKAKEEMRKHIREYLLKDVMQNFRSSMAGGRMKQIGRRR